MNKKLIIIIAIVLIVVILAGVSIWFFALRDSGEKTTEISHLEYPLGEQYMNIKVPEDAARKTVLKCNPVIQYTKEEFKTVLTDKSTTILTEMRKYFMNRTSEQLENLDRVQEDLTDLVIDVTEADPDTVTNILFLDFIIQ